MNNGCIPAEDLIQTEEELTSVCELCSERFPAKYHIMTSCACDGGYVHHKCGQGEPCVNNPETEPDDNVKCLVCEVCDGKHWIRTDPECDAEFRKLGAKDIQNLNDVVRMLDAALDKEIKPTMRVHSVYSRERS